jgi:hypothetical protein
MVPPRLSIWWIYPNKLREGNGQQTSLQMAARSSLMHSRRTRCVNLDGMVFPLLWFNHQFAGCVNIDEFEDSFFIRGEHRGSRENVFYILTGEGETYHKQTNRSVFKYFTL